MTGCPVTCITLVRTKNLFIAISLVKLNHSHRKYSRKKDIPEVLKYNTLSHKTLAFLIMDPISKDFLHLSVADLHTSSGPSTTSALERISLECNVFTDDDHISLDVKIVKVFSTFWKHNEEPELSELLS